MTSFIQWLAVLRLRITGKPSSRAHKCNFQRVVFQELTHLFYTEFDWLIFKETLQQIKRTLFQLLLSCACVRVCMCSDNNCVSIWQKQRAWWKRPKVVSFYSRWHFFFLISHWWLIPPCWPLCQLEQIQNFSLIMGHPIIPLLGLRPSSLELGDLERWRAGKIQEKGSFLFGQEGGGGDVVDACWNMFHLHVTEAASGITDGEEEEIPPNQKNTEKNKFLLL